MRTAGPFLALLVAASVLTAACREATAGIDPRIASARRDSLQSLLAARNVAFAAGDWDRWAGPMADDVYLTAAEPGRALFGRDTILATMRADYAAAFAAGLTMHIAADSQDIWMDDSAQVAAVSASLKGEVSIADRHIPLQLRSTTLLAFDSTGWKVLVEHYSRPVAYDSLFMGLVSRTVRQPAPVGQSVSGAAGELVNQFQRDRRDFSKAPFAKNVVVVTPHEIVHGAAAASAALGTWMGLPGNATETGSGVRADLTPDGRAGWVTTNLYVPIFAGPESSVAPVRVLLLYHLAGDHWEIVQAHFSVGSSQSS